MLRLCTNITCIEQNNIVVFSFSNFLLSACGCCTVYFFPPPPLCTCTVTLHVYVHKLYLLWFWFWVEFIQALGSISGIHTSMYTILTCTYSHRAKKIYFIIYIILLSLVVAMRLNVSLFNSQVAFKKIHCICTLIIMVCRHNSTIITRDLRHF